ncbi:hypothetical protein SAMN05421664_1839 [Chryseobacterium soldanellicola]|uniref:Uncharacterized protein n=1 Tax=Chryseobacterium soldanellicola TaxID=311333 RepID=A0A1H1BEK4_9FLAO|nr:hypothetical protein [Chryseobacterium soldanellicola]SDQ50389.1 hypothetical protein SAMN05421664_1839 [Chryseobacterium soldanellicola]
MEEIKKNLLIIFIFMFHIFNSQIKININVVENTHYEIRNEKRYKLLIKITNESTQKYILPIDITGFKNYMSEEPCSNFNLIDFYPDLGFLPMFKNEITYIEGSGINYPHLVNNKRELKKYQNKINRYKKNKSIKLNKWIKDNKLNKVSKEWAEINQYLLSNLLTLNSEQSFSFEIYFNPLQYNYVKLYGSSYSYPIESNKTYQFSLQLCIEKNIYQYLTEDQKDKFKDYKFFNGKIMSNEIDFKMVHNYEFINK